jgi:CHAD domain-containing protein
MQTPRKSKTAQRVKACALELASDDSALAAFKIIATTLLAQIQANRQGVIEGRDPEHLHRMRVAVRRLRSLCGAYADIVPRTTLQPFVAQLKWLGRALGPARDADVFAIEIWPPLREVLVGDPLLPALDKQWAALRQAAARKARRALATRRYQRFVRAFSSGLIEDGGDRADIWRAGVSTRQWSVLDRPARDFSRKLIKHRDSKVRGHGQSLKRLRHAQLHALRIQIKKLRYAVDGFGSLFERTAVQDMLAHLSRLQDILGKLNDMHAAERQVAIALARIRGPESAAYPLRAVLAQRRKTRSVTLRRKLHAAWRAYRHAQKFWKRG